MATRSSAAPGLDQLDIGRGLALISDQIDKALPFAVPGVEIVAVSHEEAEKALEVIDAKAAVGLDQLVQRRWGVVSRFRLQKQLDRLIPDLVANHLLLVFTHAASGPRGLTGAAVYSSQAAHSTRQDRLRPRSYIAWPRSQAIVRHK